MKPDSVDSFNVYPRLQILVDKHLKFLPPDVGKQPKNGGECHSCDSYGQSWKRYTCKIRKAYSFDNARFHENIFI